MRAAPTGLRAALEAWLAETYPSFPHAYPAASGAAILGTALRAEPRSTVILPAFTSYVLSGAATAAGKRAVHVDADPHTLHMDAAQVESSIQAAGAADCVLLVDHTCGYPFPGLAELRRRHPELLLIEDCVRALGGTSVGRPLGSEGDWTLLSLYKTTPANLNGAILLSRKPLSLPPLSPRKVTLKQLAALSSTVRDLRERLRGSECDEPDRQRGTLDWRPIEGAPNRLCVRSFVTWLRGLERRCKLQRAAAARVRAELQAIPALRFVDVAPTCESAAHFLSFVVSPPLSRNRVLEKLRRKGCYLDRTWHVVPAFYRGFGATFPYGSAGSVFLADHVIHIPLAQFLTPSRQTRLIRAMLEAVQ